MACCCCDCTAGQPTPFAGGAAGHMVHSAAATLPQQQQQHVQQPQALSAAPRAAQAADDDGSEVSSLQQLLLSQQRFSSVVRAEQLPRVVVAAIVASLEARVAGRPVAVVMPCWVAVTCGVELGNGGNAAAAAAWGTALCLWAPFSALACRSACMPCQCNPILPRACRMSGGTEPLRPLCNTHRGWGCNRGLCYDHAMITRKGAPHGSRHQRAQEWHQYR